MSAQQGYVIFLLSAKKKNTRGKNFLNLDDLDGNSQTLLEAFFRETTRLTSISIPQTDAEAENAYRLNRHNHLGRSILIQASAGPFGTSGRLVDVDSGNDAPYNERKATMVDLRAFLSVPPNGKKAVLICERRGNRHLRTQIEEGILKPIEDRLDITFSITAHIDPVKWKEYLENSSAYSVTAVYVSDALEDVDPRSRRKAEVKMTATGNLAKRARERLGDALDALFEGRIPAHFEIEELKPKNRNLKHKQYDLVVKDEDNKSRTITVDKGEFPQWIYVFDEFEQDADIINTWSNEAHRVLSPLETSLQAGWPLMARPL